MGAERDHVGLGVKHLLHLDIKHIVTNDLLFPQVRIVLISEISGGKTSIVLAFNDMTLLGRRSGPITTANKGQM